MRGDDVPLLNKSSGTIFELEPYTKEEDFERDIVATASQIFGASSVYINVKKRMKGNNVVTIPDGYVIDLTDVEEPKLFVVENEIVGHDPFRHIGMQMLKFVTSFEDAQRSVRDFLMNEIAKNRSDLQKLDEAATGAGSRNVDAYLDKAVYREFQGIVVIDEAREELHQVLRRIAANISVLEFKRFKDLSGNLLYQFDTLYDEYVEPDTESEKHLSRDPELSARRRARRAKADTIVVPARKEGFEEVFIGENQWRSIRIGAAMKDKLRYIAAYQVAPISAITHLAEIQKIVPYKDTGKYAVIFKGPAREIDHIPAGELKRGTLQGLFYTTHDALAGARSVDEILD